MPSSASVTVDLVLDAALGSFDAVGYSATPVPAIAERAGVAVGSLYRVFPGKEAMANALYQREKQRLASALFDGVDVDGPAEETFATIWRRLARYAIEHPEALCFLELHHHAAYLDATSMALAERLDETVAAIIGRWQARGEVRSGDPALLHLQVFGGFVAVVRSMRRPDGTIPDDVGDVTLGPAWALLRTEH